MGTQLHVQAPARARPGRRGMFASGLGLSLVLFCGCNVQSPDRPADGGTGPGHREQHLGLTPAQEVQLGREAYQEVLGELRERLLPQDSRQTRKVREVTERIIRAAKIRPLQKEINLDLREYVFEWEVNVVRDNQANAFCLPGGKIIVFTGIFQVAEDDAQLATVLSHEIAHALAHHASERLAMEKAGGLNILRKLSFNRHQESEADHIGVFLMTFAGYDPTEAIRFWQRMMRAQQGRHPPEFLSDHPSDETRIHDLERWVPRALAGKKAFDEGRIAPGAKD